MATKEIEKSPFLPFHRPSIGEEEIQQVVEVLRSGWLTTGPQAKQFEAEFSEFVRAPHAVAVNSCTAALHLALAVLDLQPGDEVIVPAMTFAASAEVVCYFRARPVFCDVLPTLNLDPQDVERKITPRTRAIIVVHMAGQPANLAAIHAIAQRHHLPVIEDAAHALPAWYRGDIIGNLSDFTCFSFYATKNLTTGEGGMLTTANPEWANRARSLSLHGISRDAWKRYTEAGTWYYEILEAGYKYNLTDIQAALGRVQLRRQMELLAERKRIAERYRALLADCASIEFPAADPDAVSGWHLFVLLFRTERLRLDRNSIIEQMRASGIGTSVHFIPLHLHPFYRDKFGYTPESCPSATHYYQRNLSLPLYPGLTDAEQDRVVNALREIIQE